VENSFRLNYGSCPVYWDRLYGVLNPLTFTENDLNDLFLYFLNKDEERFRNIMRGNQSNQEGNIELGGMIK